AGPRARTRQLPQHFAEGALPALRALWFLSLLSVARRAPRRANCLHHAKSTESTERTETIFLTATQAGPGTTSDSLTNSCGQVGKTRPRPTPPSGGPRRRRHHFL